MELQILLFINGMAVVISSESNFFLTLVVTEHEFWFTKYFCNIFEYPPMTLKILRLFPNGLFMENNFKMSKVFQNIHICLLSLI